MEIISLVIALLTGLGLGLFYFGCLWLTVKRLTTVKHPYRLILVSFLLRLAISLTGFYLILISSGEQKLISLLTCILGFFIIRGILIRRLQPE